VPSTVDPTILAKDADAFRRAVDRITAIPAGVLKAENAHAAQLGSEIDADKRSVVIVLCFGVWEAKEHARICVFLPAPPLKLEDKIRRRRLIVP